MSLNQIWHQNSSGIEEIAEELDLFGFTLIAGDFNDDGIDDLASAATGEDVGDAVDAGSVNIIYGSEEGLDDINNQIWSQNTPGIIGNGEESDNFGHSLAVGDFDNDGIEDLVIGVPGETVDNMQDSGAVNVIYGSTAGLTATGNQLWHHNSPDIVWRAREFDTFGSTSIAGDFNNDGIDDLAIGVPGKKINDSEDAGLVNIIYGSVDGLTSIDNRVWHQDSAGIEGLAEASNHFGQSLTAGDFNGDGRDDLAIGIPSETINQVEDSGAVNIIYNTENGLSAEKNQIWHQDSSGIAGDLEEDDRLGQSLAAGDFDGDGRDDLAIGVANEDVEQLVDAGAVNVIYGGEDGLTATDNQIWHQNSPGITGVADNLDNFGSKLAVGDFNGDGKDDLAIAVIFESVEDIEFTGAVNVIYGSDNGLTATDNQIWHQNSPEIVGQSENFDAFGSSLSVGDFDNDGMDDLAIGAPFDSIGDIPGAGVSHILYGSENGLTAL